jgi:hypothetical protein
MPHKPESLQGMVFSCKTADDAQLRICLPNEWTKGIEVAWGVLQATGSKYIQDAVNRGQSLQDVLLVAKKTCDDLRIALKKKPRRRSTAVDTNHTTSP